MEFIVRAHECIAMQPEENKMIIKSGIFALSSLAIAICAGASQAAAQEPIVIGVSFDKMESFREGELNAIKAAAAAKGAKIVFQNAQEDAQRQASQIESMIAQGAKAIIAIPWDIEAAVNDANNARGAGVAYVTLDQAPADLKAVDFHVGGDPCADGTAAGEFFAKAAGDKPYKLLELQGGLSNDNGIRRSKCLDEVLAKHSNIVIVAQVPTDWKPEKALTGTENALQAHPDLNAIYSPWNIGLQGVFSVLEKAGKLKKVGEKGHIDIVSIDGAPTGCQAVRDGLIDMDLATPVGDMAAAAVDAAIAVASGGKPAAPTAFLPGTPYTPADVATQAPKVWGCVAG
ncbi:sugar ABC transporter substrate-binding protein [Mesorhizobium australicum]|uniref:sugar ABC transporter substrate-binding protein n=1 Tax=Mesorhizobium australicum TaxID=536018 RepID=UPI0033384E80